MPVIVSLQCVCVIIVSIVVMLYSSPCHSTLTFQHLSQVQPAGTFRECSTSTHLVVQGATCFVALSGHPPKAIVNGQGPQAGSLTKFMPTQAAEPKGVL